MKTVFVALGLSAVSLMLISPDATAQSRTSGSPSRSSGSEIVRNRDQQERAIALDHMPDNANKGKPKDPKLAYAEIREDFVRVQQINNQLLEAASRFLPDGPEPIEKAAAEMTKRAERLKTNLVLPPPQPHPDKNRGASARAIDQDDLVAQIKDLDDRITTFVNHPMFSNPQLLDSNLSATASDNLESLIEASRSLRRNAEKLRKQTTRK